METNEHQLKALIAKGEGLVIEFKACRNQLPKSVYETVCSFLNRHGGTLLLGVQDDGKVQGIAPEAVDRIHKEFVHREYASGATSRLIIEYGRVVTDNPSRPHGFGLLTPETMVPYQKNPILSAFFREIDRADELGSGMRKMMLYGRKYGGADPQLIEGDNFRMIISVPEFGKNPAKPSTIRKRIEPGAESRAESKAESKAESGAEKILSLIQDGPLSKSEIARKLELKTITGSLNRSIKGLLFEGMIEYTIPGKPNSRLQKYRITLKGKAILENRHA